MLEFIGYKQTVFLVLTNILAIIVMRDVMKSALTYPYVVFSSKRRNCVILCFLFCLFSFWGADWFGYISEIQLVQMFGNKHSNLEPFYIWLIQLLPDSYLLFRFAIWGSALILFLKTIKMLPLSFDLALLIFCTTWLPLFSYARASLAMAIMFYGVAWYYTNRGVKGAFVKILSVAIILSAFFFHKSAAFGILALFFAIFSKNINRNWMFIYVCLFPILVYVVQLYMDDFMAADVDRSVEGMEAYVAVGKNYLSAKTSAHGIGTNLQLFLEHVPFYFLAYFCYIFMQSPRFKTIPNTMKIFVKTHFIIIMMASVFMFDFGVNTDTIYCRLMRYSIIPGVIVLTYFYQNELYKVWPSRIYKLAFFSMVYSLFYVAYNVYVK